MKIGSDKIKYPGRFFAAVLLLFLLILVLIFANVGKSLPKRAKLLMDLGNYTAAAELYLELGDEYMYQRCFELYTEQCYLEAQQSLQRGDYAAATETFAALGDYKESSNFLDACCYLWANELLLSGDCEKAIELALSLGDYPGRAELLEAAAEGVVQQAGELALKGNFAAAEEKLLELGSLASADKLAAQARHMAQWLANPYPSRVLDESKKFRNAYYNEVYVDDLAYVIVPEECSTVCRFLLYFPGGKDNEINIDFLYYYLMNPAPDTVAIFLRSNGIYDVPSKTRAALDLMEKTAAECGVFIREIVSCGSSLGAYPAMQSAVYIPQQSGIAVPCVLSLDAGDDWNSPFVLSRSQCLESRDNGTTFYLFESPWVGTDRAAIRLMVETGNDVILVGCTNDDHLQITLDAMGMGVLHWAVGDRTEPCLLDIYTFTRLTE